MYMCVGVRWGSGEVGAPEVQVPVLCPALDQDVSSARQEDQGECLVQESMQESKQIRQVNEVYGRLLLRTYLPDRLIFFRKGNIRLSSTYMYCPKMT